MEKPHIKKNIFQFFNNIWINFKSNFKEYLLGLILILICSNLYIISYNQRKIQENYLRGMYKMELKIKNLEKKISLINTISKDTIIINKKIRTNAQIANFINKWSETASKLEEKFGYPSTAILAIGALESGWGTSYAAKKRFNFHGLYGGSKSYKNEQTGFEDFAYFLNRYSRYNGVENIKDPCIFVDELCKRGYNPYKHYPGKVYEIINLINEYKRQ